MAFRRPLSAVLLATFAVATLIAGCASSGGTTAAGNDTADTVSIPPLPTGPLEKTTIVVDAVPTTDSVGLYLAQYRGYFKKAGLNVIIQPATSDETVLNAQAVGKIDVTAGNYVSLLEAQEHWNNGLRPVSAAVPTPNNLADDTYVIAEASVMNPGFVGLFVPSGSPIRTAHDLKGKTIGINAPGNVAYLMTAAYLSANDMSPYDGQDVHFKYIPFPLMIDHLLKIKDIQVAFLAEPFISIGEQAAGLTELTNLDEGMILNFPVEGYAVTKKWARQNPNTLKAFLHALEMGQQLADTDRTLAERAIVAEVPQLTKQFAALLTMENYPLGPPDVTRLQRVADDMSTYGLISAGFNVKSMILPQSAS